MKLFDKVKNMFTEEVEEEKPIKREVRHVEIPTPKIEEPQVIEDKKEDKLLFFDDKDFEDLEREEERVVKAPPKKEETLPYKGAKPVTTEESKRVFKPSPIISPVYGILDKNYKREDIVAKKSSKSAYHSENITVDDVRERAFSTLEDDLKNEILEGDYLTSKREVVEDDLDIFKDIEEPLPTSYQNDSIKDEKEDMIKEESIDDDFLDDTEYLAQKLEEQKRKLDEINEIINDNNTVRQASNVDEYLYREQENKENLKQSEIKENRENEEMDISDESDKSVEMDVVEQKEETEEVPVQEIEHPIIEEVEETKEIPKSLDEVYKDTLDDLDEASFKTEKKNSKSKKEDMSDSELLNLIDSMYEKSDENE